MIHDIKIGKNTILGANSVAVKNLDDNSVYVGNPAKKIKKRKKVLNTYKNLFKD